MWRPERRSTSSSRPAFKASNLLPLAFVVSLNDTVPINTVLSGANNVKLVVTASPGAGVHNVAYWAGYYNTPSTNAPLTYVASGTTQYVLLATVSQLILDHVYVTASTTNGAAIYPGQVKSTSSVVQSTYDISSFSDPITMSSSLIDICATTTSFASITASFAGSSQTLDLSGVTVKQKYALGDAIPSDGQASTFSTGSDNWHAAAIDDKTNTLFAAFGNGAVNSFDRYQVLLPVLNLQKKVITDRLTAIQNQDVVALKAAKAEHAQILALNAQQMALLSDFDKYYKEDSVHAIDSMTGALKWSTQLEGTDPMLLTLANPSLVQPFGFFDPAAASALGIDSFGDFDANNVAFHGKSVYASTKGGTMAVMDKDTGAILRVHKYAPGVAAGGAAPGNYAGTCVTTTGIMIGFATTITAPFNTPTGQYAWIMDSGLMIKKGNSILVGWDPVRDVELWSYEVQAPVAAQAGGISCIEDRVLAICPEGVGTCNYDAHTGAISQTVIPSPMLDNGAFESFAGTNTAFTTKSFICDGPECWSWNDGAYINKFVMV